MSAARRIVVELDEGQARYIDRKVASGEYASPAAVLVEALSDKAVDDVLAEMPMRTDAEREALFREAVAQYLADPSGGVELDQAFDELEAEWAAEDRG